jgi:gliding motility-associated-like protein
MNMKKLTLLFLLLSSLISFSQLSNKHWIPPLHSRDGSQISDQYIYMSTNETSAFQVTATDGSGNPYIGSPFTLSAATPVVIPMGTGQPTKMFLNLSDVNTVVSNKGIILEGTKDFYVSFRMRNTNHAETIISKGRPGIGTSFRLGSLINETKDDRKNFVASVMATENNTTVKLSDYNPNVVFSSGTGLITADSQTFTLNAGQSIVFTGYCDVPANIDGMIGGLVTSNKPVAVNTGNALGGIESGKADLTLDQIVSASQIGTEYIFIEGNGSSLMENPLIVANENGTAIYVNGGATPVTTINAGQYYLVPNSYYQGSTTNKNIYVRASKPVFAYQLLGGGSSAATSGLNFIPPLSCFFQNAVNIPAVDKIGSTVYTADLMILTYSNATITINGVAVPTSQAQAVLGNSDWVSYRVGNQSGNLNVVSTGPLAVGVFGFVGTAAGFAGYYSGFGSTPQDTNVTICSNSTKDLFNEINGNPGTGGTWSVPTGGSPLNGNVFDPAINLPGEYSYTFTKMCNTSLKTISVKVNVTIQPIKKIGVSTSTSSCATTPSYDLFSLLGNTAEVGGSWSPSLTSGTGVFNPAVDTGGIYSYSFAANGVCPAVSSTINVNNSIVPIIKPITDFIKCDDAIDGNATNGAATFDLTLKNGEVLGTQLGVNVSYHTSQSDANLGINGISTINTSKRIIYVRLTLAASGCFLTTTFNLVVNPLPVVNDIEIIQCDDDLDLKTYFNLMVKNDLISSNSANENFTYYTSLAGANTEDPLELISNPKAFQNINPPLPAPQGLMYVWARVSNKITGCFSTSKLTLKVAAVNIPSPPNISLPAVCDDFLDVNGNNNTNNDDRDGISTFDLSSTEPIIRTYLPTSGTYFIKYYRNKTDALVQQNEITNLTNYRNIGYPKTQDIWVRINSDISNTCFALGPWVTLKVQAKPFAHSVSILRQCDDNTDGIFNFDTANLESDLLQGQTGVAVTYFDAANNPLRDSNNNLIKSPFPATFLSKSQTIRAVVTNTTPQACWQDTTIQFIVDKSPVDFTIPVNLTTACDDEKDPALQNGQLNFTNSQAIHDIVTLGQPTGMVYEYYDENNVLLSTPLPNPLTVSLTKNIKIVVYNPLNPNCKITKTITYTVQPVPVIELETTKLVCSNDPTFFVILDASITDVTLSYEWYKDGVLLPTAKSYTLNVNIEGIYTVKVINSLGCFRIRKITVVASDAAHFQMPTIMDLSENNTVIINATGLGNYVYSLDYPNTYQTINIFTDVTPGIHTVYVKDLDGCGTSSQVINVIGIPKFFTPNSDGFNDTWNVLGLTSTNNFKTIIYIFDRYGKLLKELSPISKGWDGTFNGQPLPSDDYWYTIYFEDGRTAKGHFSLKR